MKKTHGFRRLAALAVTLALACAAHAGERTTMVTRYQGTAVPYLGSEHRETLNAIIVDKPSVDEGMRRLQPVLAWCAARFADPSAVHVSLRNDAERSAYAAEHPDAGAFVVVDIACPSGYKLAAFYAVERGDLDGALAFLDKATAAGPYFSEAWSERGFILNGKHDARGAVDAYSRAVALSERFPDNGDRAVALRGLGYSLVETGDLEAARKAYEDSLLIDPGNKIAKDELEFIDGQLKKMPAKPEAPAPVEQPKQEDIRQRVIDTTRKLETDPFSDQAKADRSWLLQWITDSPDVGVMICDTMGLMDEGSERDFTPEILMQGMAGNAVWQLEHPGSGNDEQAMQLAAVRSALKVYAAFMKKFPTQRIASLDTLAKHEAKGDLDAYLAPIVAEKCMGKD